MTTMLAITSGLRATGRAKWMVLIFFATNLLLAAAIAAPMQTAIADHLGNSAVGMKMARGFDWSWLTEFQIAYAPFLKSFSIAIVYGAILFLVLNTLLSAGAFEYFARCCSAPAPGRDPITRDTDIPALHAFGRGIGKYFLRFARIVIVASLFYYGAFWLWQVGAAKLLERAFEDSPIERWHFYLEWVRWALLIFTVLVINIVVDYAKADVAVDQHRSALAAIGHAAGFVFANFTRVLSIYVSFAAFAVVTVFIYSAFARFFPQSSVTTVLIWFLVAQALLWLRWMLRLASWAAAMAFYSEQRQESVRPQPTAVEVQA